MKDESYVAYKYPRAINSRSDYAKIRVGPIFALISEQVMHHKYNGYMPFIKHVPIADRPKYIWDHLRPEGRKIFAGDYEAFEALFKKCQMQLEIALYKHCTKNLPDDVRNEFWWYLDNVLSGTNKCYFKNFKTEIEAVRMSGEMCTSLGNGFFNLMVLRFLLESLGHEDVQIFVEGDDSLAAYTAIGEPITAEHFARLGLKIKIEEPDSISTASFCGIVFAPEDMINVTDPKEVLAGFAWLSARYANSKTSKLKSLLRAKSLSYLHQYPGCPIIQELALYGLRITAGHDLGWVQNSRHMSLWEREQLDNAIQALGRGAPKPDVVREVPIHTRLLVEELYGLSVDRQREIEHYLATKVDLSPLLIDFAAPSDWRDYDSRYVMNVTPTPEGIWFPRYEVHNRPPAWYAGMKLPT